MGLAFWLPPGSHNLSRIREGTSSLFAKKDDDCHCGLRRICQLPDCDNHEKYEEGINKKNLKGWAPQALILTDMEEQQFGSQKMTLYLLQQLANASKIAPICHYYMQESQIKC